METQKTDSDARPTAVFDGRFLGEAADGIGVYSLQMLSRIPRLAPDIRFLVLFRTEAARDSAFARSNAGSLPNVEARIVPAGPFSPKSHFLLPRLLRREGAKLFHSPHYILPYPAFPRGGGGRCRAIANLHDLIPLVVKGYAPNSLTSRLRGIYRLLVRESVLRADAVVTGSESARADILREAPPRRGAEGRVRVIYDGADPVSDAAPRSPVRDASDHATPRTILYVGRRDPYKNVPLLVEALKEIQAGLPFPVRLVVIGKPDPRYPEPEQRAEALGLSGSVDFRGFVPAAELEAAYRSADLLVHPSRYEGFGLELVEAMGAGTPVVCTDGGSQPEVAGDAAIVVPANDRAALAAAAVKVLGSPDLQRRLRDLGRERARLFSWDATAARTLALYRELL